jgi:hypothetical protein
MEMDARMVPPRLKFVEPAVFCMTTPILLFPYPTVLSKSFTCYFIVIQHFRSPDVEDLSNREVPDSSEEIEGHLAARII